MNNQVVVHYMDGKVVKGITGDFFPNKNAFHLQDNDSGEMTQINAQNLKAIYFVKSFEGEESFIEQKDLVRTGYGRKIQVSFNDGEVQYGYTQGYSPNRSGFFVTPCDEGSNNIRIFVMTAATEKIQFV